MPGKDGTGPLGMGPMSGRGMGYCARPVRGAWGRGFRPCGWGFAPYPNAGYEGPAQEKERLAEMEKALAVQLAEVRRMQERLAKSPDEE